jgi:hypothetical protein
MKRLVSMPQVVEQLTYKWFSCAVLGDLEALRFALSVTGVPEAAHLEDALFHAAFLESLEMLQLLANDYRMTSGPHWNEAFLNSRSVEVLRFNNKAIREAAYKEKVDEVQLLLTDARVVRGLEVQAIEAGEDQAGSRAVDLIRSFMKQKKRKKRKIAEGYLLYD